MGQGWQHPLRLLGQVLGGVGWGGAHLAEIQRLLLLEVGAWPLLPVGDGSR